MSHTAINQKEAILDVPYNWGRKKLRKFFKGNEYIMDLFGLYTIRREGNAKEIQSEIKGFLEPRSLSRRHPNWSWELTKDDRYSIEFKGYSNDVQSMRMVIHAKTSPIDSSVEELQRFFNLLKVPFPRKYRKKLQDQEKEKA